MEKTSAPVRWWDWASVGLLFVLLETVASRLVATTWTPFLYLAQTATYLAFVVGMALGYSRFSRRLSQWLSAIYMGIMLPLQWTLMIDQRASLEEQLLSVAGRLFFSTSDFLGRRPVEDPLFFVVVMTIAFWFISAWAGFALVRNQNYLNAVLPAAIGLLIIQNYDRIRPGRLWFIAFFAFVALLLLGRLNFLQNRKSWRERRIFLSPDNSLELTSSMAVAAGLIILVSWSVPASLSSWSSAVRTWDKLTKPWHNFTDNMENAVSALEAPSGAKAGEFFGSQLPLGLGFPLSDAVMFEVEAPDLPTDQKPPRYYWRGRSYDYFMNGQWYSTGTVREDYTPSMVNPFDVNVDEKTQAHFVFNTGDASFSLLYSPAQPIWVSRSGLTFTQQSEQGKDLVAWHAYPWLKSGETYQVDAVLTNPNLQQLQEAGTEYPDWIKNKYLQLPKNFSPQIRRLANEITTGAETPYEKATAITDYLRENIEYASTIPAPPKNADVLEWVIFQYRKGFCVYYASSEVVMLRSLGIPARMAVGFAQGERSGNKYIVRRKQAHAWPEVYFPGIGWVEFEPTGNQPVLNRPLPPNDPNEANPLNPLGALNNEDSNFANRERDVEGAASTTPVETPPLSPLFYAIPIVLLAAAATLLINHRYPLSTHVPVLVRATLERAGFEVPKWIYHWEYWGHLSSIEKAFESINFGLRTLDHNVPVHTTPVERAKKLTGILPKMSAQIKVLLDEHQTSLYTSRVANVIPARRAAFDIRKQVILERIRYLFYGKPLRD
ncbi:MAG: transglutaminase domain-containing protein [Byssovorax cruenta]